MRRVAFLGSVLSAALLSGSALAQDNAVFFSPELDAQLSQPTGFDGLYAGVLLGPISARKNNFNTQGAEIRPELGAVLGWNQPVAEGVVVGGEVQATIATDLETSYLRLMALARLGFAAGDNTLIYLLGGVGRLGEGWAVEGGIGAEVAVSPNMALRLEAAGIGQLGTVPSGNDVPAVSALRITGGAIWHLDGPPLATSFNSGPVTDFAGAYAGLNIGSLADPSYNFFENYGFGWHLSRFEMGGFAGYTHALNDHIRVGAEAQLGVNYDTSGDAGLDLLALGKVGVVPTPGVLVYATGGLGSVEGKSAYAYGAGAEYALWGDASLRAEALVLGRLDGEPGLSRTTDFPTSKVTLGAVWHFN